ncbi:hypothetical protein H632_c425p1 [Helicosporidium sp. ATCC 50920]|nr:hypothetical protein H632_c425p1 [Helicosporidium sp. ATCC 50920]|eukprot:KDD75943.1 hypothetical protein H632_c425p1 [Helicosporidium sp. ATCC 50920]
MSLCASSSWHRSFGTVVPREVSSTHADPFPSVPSPLARAPIPSKLSFKAEAMHVGASIDLQALARHAACQGRSQHLYRGCLVVGLAQDEAPEALEGPALPPGSYMAAFTFGSVVFFDARDSSSVDSFLKAARECCARGPAPASSRRWAEEFAVVVDPSLKSPSELSPERIALRRFDANNLLVIAQVLAQSVALDAYASAVEAALTRFCEMSRELAGGAKMAGLEQGELLRLVASNNIALADIISKLGVHERFDVAWKTPEYGRVWEFLRGELELEGRFKTLDMKLNFVQDNLKYFLEIIQNRKNNTLEWIIIFLIGAEIGLTLVNMAQHGAFV